MIELKNALEWQTNPDYTFANYLTGNNKTWRKIINLLLETEFTDFDCIVIKSSGGMGGTHILDSFYNELINNNKQIKKIGFDLSLRTPDEIENVFETDFLLADGFHNIYHNLRTWKTFQKHARIHFRKGRKLIVKINHQNINRRFYDFFFHFRLHEIYPVSVEPEILFQMADSVDQGIKNILCENELKWLCGFKPSSYRVFQNFIVMGCYLKLELKSDDNWKVQMNELHKNIKTNIFQK